MNRSMDRVDAVIIGAGLNGLTAAARLGGAGLSVLIVERSAQVGGGAAHGQLAPGYSAPPIGFSHGYVPPELIREFDLAREGLQLIRREGGISLFDDGSHVANYANENVMRRELARHSRRDADAWPRFVRDMKRQAELIRQSLLKAQEDPGEWSLSGLKQMMSRTKSVLQMEPDALYDLTRFWSLSLDDFLEGYFESPEVRAHLAAPALIGRALGPADPTGAAFLPAQWMTGSTGGAPWRMSPKGGTQALADCLAGVVRARGGDIRFNAEVTDIKMVDKKAAGVVLADGEEIDAGIVLSDLDIKRSFLSLFQWSGLPDGFARDVANVRMDGIVARINFALKGLPEIKGVASDNPALSGGLMIGGGLDSMERAYEDWLDERPPSAPLLEIAIPTLEDPSLAPEGGHIFAVSAQYIPTELHDGVWSDARREALMRTVRDMISHHAPGFENHIVAEELRLPSDIEDQAGYTRGDPFLGQMSLDQMFFNRPVPGFSGYESPIKNFYVCSASGHPAGLALGAAGANAAQNILGLLKGRRS
jgi:phytoene dehydrogenase-like protein